MRRHLIIPLMLAVTLWATSGASAITENVEGLFIVEYEPTSFHLRPDDTGTLTFDIENVSNETWEVALRFTRTESGFTRAVLHPSLFELEANASRQVRVSVQTRAKFRQEPGSSDFDITMYWGKDIVQHENTWVDQDTVEGQRTFDFPVRDDLSEVNALYTSVLLVIIVMSLSVGVALAFVWRRR